MCINCDTCKFSYSNHHSNYNCFSLDRKNVQDWQDKNLILIMSKRSLTESTDLYELVKNAKDCPGWKNKINISDSYDPCEIDKAKEYIWIIY